MQKVPFSPQSSIYLLDQSSLAQKPGSRINFDRVIELYRQLVPLTLPSTDPQGNTLQLWKVEKYGLIGSVMDRSGHIQIIPSHQVITPLNSGMQKDHLLKRLEKCMLRKWSLVFNPLKMELIIWPHLIAAGNGEPGQIETYQCKLNSKTLSAAVREKNGEVVSFHKTGRPYDHQKKVKQNLKGLNKHIDMLKNKLNSPHLSNHEREQFQLELSRSENLLRYVNASLQLNYKAYRRGINTINHSDQRAQAVFKKHIKLFKGHRQPPGEGPSGGAPGGGKPSPTPGGRHFREVLQKNGLTSSYNSNHADHPVPAKGAMSGEIGGVGCSTELIRGLFDHPDALFENEHVFFLPMLEDGQLPMTDAELRQILRELAIGIYVHDTVPFFSLHFNQSSDLYPVIHPAYENTLVGQIIGFLDYFMKGYLNGGIFEEEFIRKWEEDPSWERKKESAVQQMIDFTSYCQKNLQGADQHYISLRQMLALTHNSTLLEHAMDALDKVIKNALSDEPAIFRNNTLFSNSFRIIAKQRSIQKADNLFVLDADFDVFYTIDPAPAYKKELEQYQKIHGELPPSYLLMLDAYEKMKNSIHDHMVKLPICSKYFAMLSVINFFCSYMMTLKKQRKVPIFPLFQSINHYGSPALYPHLPLEHFKEEALQVNHAAIMREICLSHKALLVQYLTQSNSDQSIELKLIQTLTQLFVDHALTSCSAAMRRHLESNLDTVHSHVVKQAVTLLTGLKSWFPRLLEKAREEVQKIRQLQLRNQKRIRETFGMYDQIRSISLSDFKAFIREINDAQSVNLFNKIRQMSSLEYEAMKASNLDHMSQILITLRTLREEELSAYIVEHYLPNLLEDQQKDILTSQANLLHLPSEADLSTIEQGKRIVGGCGMALTPMKIIPSLKGEAILQEHWSVIQQLEPETWGKIEHGGDNELSGVVFKLMFEDLPPEMDEDYSWMENLFVSSSQEMAQLSLIMQQLKEAMLEEDEERFVQLIQEHSHKLDQMRDNSGATLIHLAAMQKNPFYLTELLKKGLSINVQDKKRYLPIHYAAMCGNKELVALLLDINPHLLNATSNNQSTPLIVATQNGQESVVRLLLDRKASYNTVTSEGYTPLHSALHHGHEEIAMALLAQRGIDVNNSTEEGVTPLMLACDLDSEKLVEELLRRGADPAAERKDGVTALDIAVKRNCFHVCKILFPYSNLSDFTIEIAVKESSLDILQLLSSKPNFLSYRNYSKDTPLILAIRFGNIPAALHILSLIQNAEDFSVKNVFNESAISLSAVCGFVELIEEMFKKGATIDPKQLLRDLCRVGSSSFLEDYLSKQKLDVDDLQELLLVAAEAGQHAIISTLLLPRQVNLDALQGPKGWRIEHYLAKSDGIFLLRQRVLKTKELLHRLVEDSGKTLAYLAAENGSWNCFKFLLAQMLKNNLPLDHHYQTRNLAYAVIERGDLKGVRLLYDSIPDRLWIQRDLDGKGTTAAHLAAKIGSKEILQFLQRQGAHCDQEDADGKTPLYYAVRCCSRRAVKFLLSEACKAKITPEVLCLALSDSPKDILDLLWKAGAHVDIQSHHTQDTPLLLAVKNRNDDAFSKLIELGASLDCMNAEGWTPTLLASDMGQHSMLQAILRRGYIDQRVYKGDNALHLACKRGHSECIRLLVLAGFAVHHPNEENKAPAALAKHSISASAALGIQETDYNQFISQLTEALIQGDTKALQKMLVVLPINEMISIQWQNEKLSGTLLHLILRLIGQSAHIKPIVDILLQNEQLNLQLRDSKGSAYSHLLAMAQIQPKSLTLDVVDDQGATPLHLAAASCDEMFLAELFKTSDAKKVIHTPDKDGMTPLFYAIIAKKIKNIEFLLNQGANPDHRDLHLNTPLLIACQKELFLVVQQLLQAGADINLRGTADLLTPLFVSLELGSDEISLYLMMKGADCHAKMRDGSTIAHAAAQSGKVHILRFLSRKGFSFNESNAKGIHPIHIAAQQGQNPVLEFLLTEDVSLETKVSLSSDQAKAHKSLSTAIKDAKPIHFASMVGRIETVHWLLNHHANPESKMNDNQGVLYNAAQANCTSLIEVFKQYRLSQDLNQIFPAISAAIQRDYANSVSTLYQLGIPINADIVQGWTGLHLACKLGSIRTTHMLLSQGADPDILNGEGQTAVQVAASNRSVDQFWQMVVRTQPDLNAVNGKGETLLHIAVKAGNLAHAMLLIDYGASLDIQNYAGETPLHAAAKMGRLDIVGLLIGCGADYTKKTFIGEKIAQELTDQHNIIELIGRYSAIKAAAHQQETLLHCAIKANIIEAVKVLCLSTDINQSISGGTTALHLAVEAESIPMIRILLSHGAYMEAQDDLGHTPLWKACVSARNVLLARFLIKAGADRTHTDKSGQTILQILNEIDFQGKEQMLNLLKA